MDCKKKKKELEKSDTAADLASLLGTTKENLIYWAYVAKRSKKYTTFAIPKRSGGDRIIKAPTPVLKELQQKLASYLSCIYRPAFTVHGYVQSKGRSILTNAKIHAGARHVLNIDLENFFPSINFGRVRGMLIAKPYNLNRTIATYIAQISCDDNQLPQGAPTSPVISNMICASLDHQLKLLAKKYKCKVTRYADDITFSTNLSVFPDALATLDSPPFHIKASTGADLESVISKNGFKVNAEKTRLMTKNVRQEVTGLSVNSFPNVKRQYVRQVRAMLYAWEKHGVMNAATEFFEKFDRKGRTPKHPEKLFKKVVKGKLDYLKMVRGAADPVFIKHARKLRDLDYSSYPHPLDELETIEQSIFVIESDTLEQGTGFFLEGVGFITCAHVLGSNPVAIHIKNPTIQIPLTLKSKSDDIDLAVLEMTGSKPRALTASVVATTLHQKVLLAGYPNYAPGHQTYFAWGNITTHRIVSTIKRFLISAPIAGGNSGGPVLDENLRVIGVAVTGADFEDGIANQKEKYGVIPISAVEHINS